MARTPRAVNSVVNTGLIATYTAVDNVNGETAPYGTGHKALHVKNTGAGACTVTITDDDNTLANGQARPAVVVPITTGDKFILLQTTPNTGTLQGGGNILIDYSLSAGVTACLLDVTPQ